MPITLRDFLSIDLSPQLTVLTPQLDSPDNQCEGEQRPSYTEQPDVDLFVGDAKKLSQLDQGDNCPIEYSINPNDAAICHKIISPLS